MSGEVMLVQVVSLVQVSSCLVRLFQFMSGYVRYQVNSCCQVSSSYFRLVQLRSDYASLGQVRSCYVRFCLSQFMSG